MNKILEGNDSIKYHIENSMEKVVIDDKMKITNQPSKDEDSDDRRINIKIQGLDQIKKKTTLKKTNDIVPTDLMDLKINK